MSESSGIACRGDCFDSSSSLVSFFLGSLGGSTGVSLRALVREAMELSSADDGELAALA